MKTRLIMVNEGSNNNKLYDLELDGDTVIATFGRVGATGQTTKYRGGSAVYERKLREKLRKGYKEFAGIEVQEKSGTEGIAKTALAPIAKHINVNNSASVETLIDLFVNSNRHAISTGSGGKIEVSDDGITSTPLGPVTSASVSKATDILNRMVSDTSNISSNDLNEYLTLVPQRISRVSKFRDTLADSQGYTDQVELLDQLRTSVDLYESRLKAAAEQGDNGETVNPFRFLIEEASDKEMKYLADKASRSASGKHSSSRMKMVRAYRVIDNDKGSQAWEQYRDTRKESRTRKLWHGTMCENMLSIISSGYYVPPTTGSSIHIAGRMFGDGVYFATSSTKSLNYSTGYWSGRRDGGSAFLLMNEVVTGQELVTTSRDSRYDVVRRSASYDSLFVKAGTCGVINDEIIIRNTDGIKISYICEFR